MVEHSCFFFFLLSSQDDRRGEPADVPGRGPRGRSQPIHTHRPREHPVIVASLAVIPAALFVSSRRGRRSVPKFQPLRKRAWENFRAASRRWRKLFPETRHPQFFSRGDFFAAIGVSPLCLCSPVMIFCRAKEGHALQTLFRDFCYRLSRFERLQCLKPFSGN